MGLEIAGGPGDSSPHRLHAEKFTLKCSAVPMRSLRICELKGPTQGHRTSGGAQTRAPTSGFLFSTVQESEEQGSSPVPPAGCANAGM